MSRFDSWFVLYRKEVALFKLAERLGSPEGIYCGREGLYVGSAGIIERRDGQYWIRQQDEITEVAHGGLWTQADVAEFS